MVRQCRGRRRPVPTRYLRHWHGVRALTCPGGPRTWHHARLDRWHRSRLNLVSAACPACGRGHPRGLRQDSPARRIRPVAGWRCPVPDAGTVPGWSVRDALRDARPDDNLPYPGAALHEGLRADSRAADLRACCPAAVGRPEPARSVPRPDRGRGRSQLAHGCLPFPPAGVLPRCRWRRRADHRLSRPRRGVSPCRSCTSWVPARRRRRR